MAVINPFDLYTAELNRLKAEESQNQNPFDIAIREQANRNLGNYTEQDIQRDIEAYNRRNEINRNDPEFQNRVQAKLNQLIDKRLTDPNVIFAAISNDPDLDAAFPTHIDKFDALKQVQESVLDAQNELNAIKGYNIENKGVIRDTLSAVGSGLLNTATSPYYAYKKHDIMNKLDNLPLNQLEGINKKLTTASQIQDKVDEAKQRMFSNDLATQTRALQELQYYKGTLDNLALTAEEQQIWDRYGKEYDSLKMQLDHINADKADLLGSRNISTDEARVLMDQYRRREEYKRQGIDPSLGDHVFDAIKDATSSFGAVGRSLGNVLSSAIPFMIPVVGGALGVASFGSTAMEYATDLMEDHLRKYNELPTEEQLKAALYGALAAGIDYYGSKGLVKGYGGVAGQFFRGIGKTDAERFASEGAKFLAQKWESTLKGLPQGSIARTTITDLTDFVSKELPNLSKKEFDSVIKDLKGTLDKEIYKETLGTKAKKAIASLPEGIMRKTLEAPVKTVEAVGKVAKGVKVGNKYLHEHFDASVQDMAKAGLGLASENVGSALVRQNYKGEYDKEEIARGLVDGFISGGAFHGISNAAYKPISGLKGVAKSTINKFMYGDVDLDNRTDFNTLTDKIKNADKDPNIAKYFGEITSAYGEKLDVLNNTIEAARTENSNLLEKFGDVGLTINDEGKASVDEAKYSSSDANVSLKALKKAVSRYNRNQKIIDKAGAEVTLRKTEWDAAVKEGANKLLEKSKTSDEYTEEEKEKIKQSYVDTLNEDGQLSFLQKEEGMSEETAKRYLEAKKNKEAVPEDYTTKVEGTDVSIHEVFERGNVDVFRFTDILESDDVRKAIANTDKVAFDNAIDDLVTKNKTDKTKGISEQRANFVKEQFNEDKFNQFTRYETKGSKDGSFKELNKAVQDDVISSLGLKDNITLDNVKKDPSKLADYVKQQLTDRTSDKTIYQKAGEVKEAVKDININDYNNIVDTTAGEVQTAIEKALKINEQLIGKKIYKKKEDAEKVIKDSKLGEAYTVNKVSEGRYVIAERDTKELTDKLSALEAKKEPITKKEVEEFIDAYTKDLNIDESSIFKLKDKLRKTFNQYNSAPEESKATTKKALIEELNKLITGRKNTLNTAKEYVSEHEAVRSAIHGYDKNKDYIKESRARKAERDLKKKADKVLKEQTVTNSVFDDLEKSQAVTLAAKAINSMYAKIAAAGIDLNNPIKEPDKWKNIKIFTLKDVRNLKALNSRLLNFPDTVQEQQYIQTLLSIIDKTTVQTDNTVNTFVSPSIVMTGDVTGNSESATKATDNNIALRKAFLESFPDGLYEVPMSIPDLELANAINEAALDYDQQEQGRAAHALNRNILNHREEIVDLLEQLQRFEVTTEDVGKADLLTLACTRAKIKKVPQSFKEDALSDQQLIEIFNAIFSCNECLRYLGLDPSVPEGASITRDDITKPMASKSITSYAELHKLNPKKGFNFGTFAGATKDANAREYNDSTNLIDRIIALDKVFGGTGSIMYVLAQNSINTDYPAIYKELLRTLEITQRANTDFYGLNPTDIDDILDDLGNNPFKTSGKGATTSEANWQMNDIQKFAQEAYSRKTPITKGTDKAQKAFDRNKVAFVKRLLLHKLAIELQNASSTTNKQNNFTDENYARLYRAYQICKGLPEYLPEQATVNPVDNNAVSRLEDLLWTVAPTVAQFDTAINELRTSYKEGKTNIDADLTDTVVKELKQSLYTVKGYLQGVGNVANQIEDSNIKTALAKILQAKVNRDATNNNASSVTTGTAKLSNNGHNIAKTYVEHSAYVDDVTVIDNGCAMLGNHANDYTIEANNPNYAGKNKLHDVWKVITGIAKEGTRFLDSGLIIDKIFGMNVNGNLVYAEEILNVLAAVGLNNIMMIAKGQSEEFLQSLVANNVISSKAKAKMYQEKFSDYETLCRSLGRQAIHSIGLRIASENSRANIEEQIAAELGARVLQLLEAKGYVSKQYVDNNGNFHSKKPEEGSSIRVVKLTDGTNGLSNDGVDLNDRLESLEKYEYTNNGLTRTGHVLEELLNETNDKYPYRLNNNNNTNEFEVYQNKLQQRFDDDTQNHRVITHDDISYETLDNAGNPNPVTFKVEIIPFTGLAKITGTTLNNGNPVYLNRKAVYKANGVMNEPLPLVELAFKSTEKRTFNKQAYDEFIGNEMNKPNVKSWTDLSENVQRALGMDLDKLKGYPETYRKQKNEQIFRRAKEFHEYAKGLSDKEELVFPVIMTPNNRFLVDSPIFDYREFKPVRDLFTIVNSTVGRVSLKTNGKVNKVKQTMAMATILFNYGIDVDKMTFDEIRKVFQKMYYTLKRMDLPNSSVSDITEKLKTIKFTVYKGVKDPEATLKTKLALPAQLLIRDLKQNKLQVMKDILEGNDLVNFHYMIEVDGLNNGSSHHFAQSDVFSNTDDISLVKAVAVGMVPKSLQQVNGTTFGDFVSLMAYDPNKFRDVYMQSAETAKQYSVASFIEKCVSDVKASNVSKRLLNDLCIIFNVDVNLSIDQKIASLMSRDVMKKVAMPSTYGAGFDALLSHLAENITKELSKRLAGVKGPTMEKDQLIRIYNNFREYNGKEDLVLLDKLGNTVMYSEVLKDPNKDLTDYLVFIEGNDKLFENIKKTCLHDTVTGAKAVTVEASERGAILNRAVEAQSKLFTAIVQKILKENYPNKSLGDITYKEQETILNAISTQFLFGTQKQSLDTLKPAVMAAIKLIDYNNKVTAHYRGGDTSVRFGSKIAKDSLGSAFSPIYIHGFDASNIAQAQQIIRQTLGAFTGIHDAVMINLKQFLGEGTSMSVPKAMNKSFVNNALTAYLPLLEMANNLQMGLDKIAEFMSPTDVAETRRSMEALMGYACLEISNIMNLLREAEKGDGIMVNQFAFGEATGFKIDAKYATEQIDKIKKSLSAKEMKKVETLSTAGFINWLKENNKAAYTALTKNKEYLSTLTSIKELHNALIDTNNPLGLGNVSITDKIYQSKSIQGLINDYVTYRQGQYDSSFFKIFTDAVSEQAKARNKRVTDTLTDNANNDKTTPNAIKELINILHIARDINSISKEGSITKLLNNKAHKLFGLNITNPDSYDILTMLVQMTTQNNISNSDLVRVKELAKEAYFLNDHLNINPLDKTANSIIVEATDVNLSDTLDYISNTATQKYGEDAEHNNIDEATAYSDFMMGYANRLKERLDKTKAKQIIFKMDSAIDFMLLPVVNQQIQMNKKNQESPWYGCTIAIAPNATDRIPSNMNKNLTHAYYLNEHFTKGIHQFTVINPTENRDNELLNLEYDGRFTYSGGITGQNYDRQKYTVSIDETNGREIKSDSFKRDLADRKPDIYIANYYGKILTLNESGLVTPNMMRTQKSPSDISGIAEYQNNVINFSNDTLENLQSEYILGNFKPVNILHETPQFIAGSHIVVGINSDGTVINDKIYNSTISRIPAFKEAHKEAMKAYEDMEKKYANDPSMNMDVIHMPITIETYLDNFTPIKVTFIVSRDNQVFLSDILECTVATSSTSNRAANYVLKTEASYNANTEEGRRGLQRLQIFRDRFNDAILNSANNDKNNVFSSWIYHIRTNPKYKNLSPEELASTRITIPKNIINETDYVYNYDSVLNRINTDKLCNLSSESNVIYLGYDANPYSYIRADGVIPTVYVYNTVKGYEAQKTIGNRIASAISSATYNTIQNTINAVRSHKYTTQKSDEDMNVYDTAVYRDLTCKDSQDLFDSLVSEDRARSIETSHLDHVFNLLKSLHIDVRYYLNNLAYSQGGAFIETINAKPTGYINFNTKGTGSHAEVFVHEYSHIPLEYLKYDANAYRLATQLYQFAAKNLTLEDFDCSREEAERIYNYIFRDTNTVDPQIEFITYSLTNANFRKALDKMAERAKFRKEFNDKKESVLARFVNTISGSLDTSRVTNNINSMVFDIFKRSVDLCNEYGKKAPRDEKAYLVEKMQLSKADLKIQNAITYSLSKISSKISDAISSIAETTFNRVRTEEKLRLAETNQDSKIANQMKDILPAMMDALPSASEGFQDIANQLRQSFEGVSDGNYEYVKLRYQAKETIDKARENASSALNEVIRKATEDIPQKTLNEMSEYVLKADMSCLVDINGYSKQELSKLLTDKAYRKEEINRIENNLRHGTYGNFYVNASKGLIDKLITGINTSGIGYNNAYEIANFSGSKLASNHTNMVPEIDRYITLSVMDKLDSKNGNVYRNLNKHLDVLMEILNIHNGLKKMEYSQVYGESMQKVHIPKGELHGGKIPNKFTVVPKSQLKAYKWAGYKDEGKVKFDPFYNHIIGEEYYKVSAKHMPNVPYVDGIPVLTDIFNGRNKSDIYLGGKKVESTQISPTFQKQEFQAVSDYINRRIQELNSPNYKPLDSKSIDGVITPTFGIGNKLSGCDFQLNQKESDKYLNRHIKFTSALGDHYGSIIERMKAPDWNIQVSQALDDLYKERHDKHDFTWLKQDTDNAEYLEIYNLLPYEMKKFFKDKYGVDGVPVETRYLTGIVGYREISANKIDKNDLEWNNKLKHSVTEYLSHIFHNGYVAKGETFLRYLTKLGKENLVIKGVAVSVDNILSNNVTLSVLGLSPEQVCKYQIEGLNNLLKYKEMSRERYMLKTKEITNTLTEADRARIRGLEASMKALPISYLAEHGAMPTIAEDLTESDRLAKDFIDRNLPKELQTFAHNAIGDQKSWVYKHLSDLATFGDITARYAQFKYLTEDKHINKEEAFRQCMQTFIDYSNPLPRNLQYFDSIGALPFTKFLLGNQTNVLNSLVKKPSRALAGIMATSAMGIPSIYDSILGLDAITNRWKVPGFGLWYDSLGSLPISRAIDIL